MFWLSIRQGITATKILSPRPVPRRAPGSTILYMLKRIAALVLAASLAHHRATGGYALRRSQGPLQASRCVDFATGKRCETPELEHPEASGNSGDLRGGGVRTSSGETVEAELRGAVAGKGALGGKADRKVVTVYFGETRGRAEDGPADLSARRGEKGRAGIPGLNFAGIRTVANDPGIPLAGAVGARRQRAGR